MRKWCDLPIMEKGGGRQSRQQPYFLTIPSILTTEMAAKIWINTVRNDDGNLKKDWTAVSPMTWFFSPGYKTPSTIPLFPPSPFPPITYPTVISHRIDVRGVNVTLVAWGNKDMSSRSTPGCWTHAQIGTKIQFIFAISITWKLDLILLMCASLFYYHITLTIEM